MLEESKYYVYKNGIKDGPFDKSELQFARIYKDTLVWRVGDEDWIEASHYVELRSIINESPPTIPKDKIGYDQVEDIAKVNYKYAYIMAGVYVALNIVASEFMFTSKTGIILNVLFPFIIWSYFKKFFRELKDHSTARFINTIFIGYFLYVILLIYTSIFNDWDYRVFSTIGEFCGNVLFNENRSAELDSLVETANFILLAYIIIVVLIWMAGIKLLKVNKRYNFPLKRIAISAMLFIPIHMFYLLISGIINQAPDAGFMHVISMIPYGLLAIHFYRADNEDATMG